MTGQASIVIYTQRITNRLRYVCNHIFKRTLQTDYCITTNRGDFSADAYILEYSEQPSGLYPFIPASGLVWEEGMIKEGFCPEVTGEKDERRLFPNDIGVNGLLDFDLFSAVFYCLSLYQAYTSIGKDQHGRIDFTHWSIRDMKLDRFPYVEIWIRKLQHQLNIQGVSARMQVPPHLHLSFDIDHCWAYKNRTIPRTLRGMGGDLLKGRFINLKRRISVLAGWSPDPYQPFFFWLDNHRDKHITLFFLMREGQLDSLNVWNDEKKALIQQVSQHFQVGLHPSYHVKEQVDRISEEMGMLESSVSKRVTQSRQHYLRWKMPDTFLALHEAGIQQEYSMGYYDQPGFIASTARPFQFYNLESEQSIDMDFHPFCWMDSMNRYYRNMGEEEEFLELQYFIQVAKEANGTAALVFHNDSFIIYRYKKILDALSEC